jgi:hypothetical protein
MKTLEERLSLIKDFCANNNDLEALISEELKKRGLKSIDCCSIGPLTDEFGDGKTNDTVYLKVGFKNEHGVDSRNKSKESLYVIGYKGVTWNDEYDVLDKRHKVYHRIFSKFNRLPLLTQVAIFYSAFNGVEYPYNYHHSYKDFLKDYCSDDLNKLPIFDDCYFADEKNALHKIAFTNKWENDGRYIFKVVGENDPRKDTKVTLCEDDVERIICGGVSQWGFDFALSFNKERLRGICIGGFSKDYTE